MNRVYLSILLVLLLSCRQSPEVIRQDDTLFVPMESKRLPDMNEPRSGHALVWASDHILAVGGHTTGFVPVATAEYYQDGRWHTLSTLYQHDTPFALVLNDGDVLIGGGYESSFGVGQTWGVERYHPATHSFTPAPIMETKRAHASATELENGQIVISGNWWDKDITEIYNDSADTWTDTASDNRSYPFILPMGNNNAWIIGSLFGSYGDSTLKIVDQIVGEPFKVDLLTDWHLLNPFDRNVQADNYRLREDTYLIPALNAKGQCAPMLVDRNGFRFLPMEQPLPIEGPWGAIRYIGSFWMIPETLTAWLMALDQQQHVYLAEIDCQPALQGGKAKLTSIYYSQPLKALPNDPYEMLLPDGSFVIVGGKIQSNYDVSAAVYAFYPKGKPKDYTSIIIGVGLAIILGLLSLFVARKRRHHEGTIHSESGEESSPSKMPSLNENPNIPLSDKLKALMEERQLFRNKDLRIADVAAELRTNNTYISAALNSLNTTFPAFVTGYRIRFAQELMRNNATMSLSQVADESGFSNERNFLRTFKAACGMTPTEWKLQQKAQ